MFVQKGGHQHGARGQQEAPKDTMSTTQACSTNSTTRELLVPRFYSNIPEVWLAGGLLRFPNLLEQCITTCNDSSLYLRLTLTYCAQILDKPGLSAFNWSLPVRKYFLLKPHIHTHTLHRNLQLKLISAKDGPTNLASLFPFQQQR